MTQANNDAAAADGPPTAGPAAGDPPTGEPAARVRPAAVPAPGGPDTGEAASDGPASDHPASGSPAVDGPASGEAASGGPATAGVVRAPVPQQAGGPPGYPPYGPGPGPGQPPAYAHPGAHGPGRPPYPGPPQQYGWRPPPMPLAPDGRPLADFGTRLLAHLIDGAILTGIAMVVFVPVVLLLIFNILPDFEEYGPGTEVFPVRDVVLPFLLIELGLILLMLAGYYIYYVEMMYRSGQTVGKKAMKIRVVPFEPGAALTRGMAAKRYLIEFPVGTIVPFFSYVDGLWQLWDKPYQQTLHDKVAKTVVVKVAP